MSEVFDTLNALNVNEHTEVKKTGGQSLTYLSWTWAWAEVKKRYPAAHYTVWRDANGLPYVFDEKTGYMVGTSVSIEGITHEMWLPVMDGANKAMKAAPYTYKTKYNGEKSVEAASMMDINKAIMRCLVKNLAMFGLGLYIYAGEDLPESDEDVRQSEKKPAEAKREPVAASDANTCEMCSSVITGVTGKDGSTIPAEKVIDIGMKRHGKCLCAACQRLLSCATVS